jgi:hypothetical protein
MRKQDADHLSIFVPRTNPITIRGSISNQESALATTSVMSVQRGGKSELKKKGGIVKQQPKVTWYDTGEEGMQTSRIPANSGNSTILNSDIHGWNLLPQKAQI